MSHPINRAIKTHHLGQLGLRSTTSDFLFGSSYRSTTVYNTCPTSLVTIQLSNHCRSYHWTTINKPNYKILNPKVRIWFLKLLNDPSGTRNNILQDGTEPMVRSFMIKGCIIGETQIIDQKTESLVGTMRGLS